MLIAFLIIDKSKFALFEYFTDKTKANEVIKTIEEIDQLSGNQQIDQWQYLINSFNERFYYCIVYSEEKPTNSLMENIAKLSRNVMKGDKLSLQQVLSARNLSDISYVR